MEELGEGVGWRVRQQFAMLALKLGEPLEEVLRMEEEERGQLVQLLLEQEKEVFKSSGEEDNVSSGEEDNVSSDGEEFVSSDEDDTGTFDAYQEVVRVAEQEATGQARISSTETGESTTSLNGRSQVKRDTPTVCLGEKVRDLWAAAERCSSTA